MDHSLEDLFEIIRIVSDSSSSCGNASSNASEWCDHYGTCNECRAALIDAIERKIADEYVRLPKDADGEYIHIGDVMGDRGFPDAKYTVVGIGKDAFFTRDASGELHEHTASLYIHYKPTVEDVLLDMHRRLSDVSELYDVDSDELEDEYTRIIAEYAKRLRLAGDAE